MSPNKCNQQQLRVNARAHGDARREGPPREGVALLQGLAICGRCGNRMTVRYHHRAGVQVPDYQCVREGIQTATRRCQLIPGAGIERAVSQLLVDLMTPASLDMALNVHDELQSHAAEADAGRDRAVQRAQHEADLAQQRFMSTHPDNRLVADVLEAEWNAKLRDLDHTQAVRERHRQTTEQRLDAPCRQHILELAEDFPRLWASPATPHRERKRMVRLLLEDVTLTRGDDIHMGIRLRGGAVQELRIPLELPGGEKYATPKPAIAAIDSLLQHHNDAEIATMLNERDLQTGHGLPFTASRVRNIRRAHDLKPLEVRLRESGWLTRDAMAEKLAVAVTTVTSWAQHGLLATKQSNGRTRCLYRLTAPHKPTKQQGRKLSERMPNKHLQSRRSDQV